MSAQYLDWFGPANRSNMHLKAKLLFILAILTLPLLLQPSLVSNVSYSTNTTPAYARVGAYALYSGDGGFVAFLSGVSANISYFVRSVFPNNTMLVFVNASITLGTEVANGSTTRQENVTDPVYAPEILPAVPAQNLTSNQIMFENITCNFVKNSMLTVPAGQFNATEFQGKDANGTAENFWFDRSTGLSIEMVQSSSYFQLVNSNIATPVRIQTPLQSELPFIIVFIAGWVGAGLLFYFLIRYYSTKAKKGVSLETNKNADKKARN